MSRPDAAAWDEQAADFDAEADHGLRDPAVRRAWRDLLRTVLPDPPGPVVDLGCGTGSLALLMAEEGHDVLGVDFSPRMVARARAKAGAATSAPALLVADVADPPLRAGSVDVVLCRHVLWALPDPAAVVRRWAALLRPGGRLVLVEGRWATGAGIDAATCVELLAPLGGAPEVRHLHEASLWGRAIEDERYLVLSRPSPAGAAAG